MAQLFSALRVLIISMTPVLELRAAIPVGIHIEPLNPALVVILSIIGNMIPVPFIIIFIRKIFAWMKKHSEFLGSIAERMERKADKHKDTSDQYASLGLLILVAIPLPGTGAWTGSLIAAMFDIKLKSAFWVILAGVAIAATIVTLADLGIISIFS